MKTINLAILPLMLFAPALAYSASDYDFTESNKIAKMDSCAKPFIIYEGVDSFPKDGAKKLKDFLAKKGHKLLDDSSDRKEMPFHSFVHTTYGEISLVSIKKGEAPLEQVLTEPELEKALLQRSESEKVAILSDIKKLDKAVDNIAGLLRSRNDPKLTDEERNLSYADLLKDTLKSDEEIKSRDYYTLIFVRPRQVINYFNNEKEPFFEEGYGSNDQQIAILLPFDALKHKRAAEKQLQDDKSILALKIVGNRAHGKYSDADYAVLAFVLSTSVVRGTAAQEILYKSYANLAQKLPNCAVRSDADASAAQQVSAK